MKEHSDAVAEQPVAAIPAIVSGHIDSPPSSPAMPGEQLTLF